MTTQIIIGRDGEVAAWMFEVSGSRPMHVEMAIGLADEDGKLVGGIAYSSYNGSDIEVHVHAVGQLTRRVVRLIFGTALLQFKVNRVTIRTRKPSMARGCEKLGAVYEGTIKRLYGPSHGDEHSGRQYGFFRETIEKLAGMRTA